MVPRSRSPKVQGSQGPKDQDISTDNMNVVADTLDEVLDEESINHDDVVVELELYFIAIHRNIIN